MGWKQVGQRPVSPQLIVGSMVNDRVVLLHYVVAQVISGVGIATFSIINNRRKFTCRRSCQRMDFQSLRSGNAFVYGRGELPTMANPGRLRASLKWWSTIDICCLPRTSAQKSLRGKKHHNVNNAGEQTAQLKTYVQHSHEQLTKFTRNAYPADKWTFTLSFPL